MPSPSPLLYDTYYHIYNRGNNRENIFIQERNYEYFLNLYAKYIEPVADTFAYSLLRNHFHLSLRVKSEEEIIHHMKTLKVSPANKNRVGQGSLTNQGVSQSRKPLGSGVLGPDYPSQQFSNFFNAYAKAINSAYGRTGSLFQHPFGRVIITSDRQFWNVIAYIHQNPQKHKFVADFRDWKWSSYGILLAEKPTSLKRDVVLDWFGGRQQYLDLHQEWVTEANSKWFAEDDDD
jgi:REP element-mobilizing transposase RayT